MPSENPAANLTLEDKLDSAIPRPLPAEHIGSSPASKHQSASPQTQSPLPRLPSRTKARNNSIGHPPIRPSPSAGHKHSASTLDARQQTLNKLQQHSEADATPQEPDFLTSLASQERRVLEIREELQKAEDELQILKKRWMSHESTKRINEGARAHQMRPMSTSNKGTPVKDDNDGSSAWMCGEMERRKALMNHGKRSPRRVFAGSRKPRPLSLVPQTANQHYSSPNLPSLAESSNSIDERMARSRTTTDMTTSRGRGSPTSFFRSPSSSPHRQSMYISTGKQLANEWRDGLWTFFEDLKHAAVGEDARMPAPSSMSRPRKRDNSRPLDKSKRHTTYDAPISRQTGLGLSSTHQTHKDVAAGDMWEQSGEDSNDDFPKPTIHRTPNRSNVPQSLPLHTRIVDGEAWETWDSPDQKLPLSAHSSNLSRSGNTSPSLQASTPASSTTHSNEATPRQSTGPLKPRDAIPWPALTKLSANQLRRTASHLMDEWERSLTEDSDRDEQWTRTKAQDSNIDNPPPLPIEHINFS